MILPLWCSDNEKINKLSRATLGVFLKEKSVKSVKTMKSVEYFKSIESIASAKSVESVTYANPLIIQVMSLYLYNH